jgi:ketosteroid isomerase-like protein
MTPKELFLEACRRTDAGDHEGFLAMQAPDSHWTVPGAELYGRDQLREWMQPFWQGFSNYLHTFTQVIESGDTVWAEGDWSGVNDGPLLSPDGEAPPTGKSVSFRFGMSVTGDWETGMANTVHLYYDQLDFLMQLGLAPEPATAS